MSGSFKSPRHAVALGSKGGRNGLTRIWMKSQALYCPLTNENMFPCLNPKILEVDSGPLSLETIFFSRDSLFYHMIYPLPCLLEGIEAGLFEPGCWLAGL